MSRRDVGLFAFNGACLRQVAMSEQDFGCDHCFRGDAAAVWAGRAGLTRVAELANEVHFHVLLVACPYCGQRFVDYFGERVDYVRGADSQSWRLVPLTEAEAAELGGLDSIESLLKKWGCGRRHIQAEFPSLNGTDVRWAENLILPPHH